MEALTVNQIWDTIINVAIMFQVVGLPGYSVDEHVSTLKSVISMRKAIDKGIIFTIVDIIAFFDKEEIFDCMETLEKIRVNKKAAMMWFNTAAGMTNTTSVGDCIGQGMVGASLISQANIGFGLQKYFGEVVHYDDIRIQSMARQDDVGILNEDVRKARNHNIWIDDMMMEKLLDAHPEKTLYIVTGSFSYKKKVKKELNDSPLIFRSFTMEEKQSKMYLDQIINSGGHVRTYIATLQEIIGRIKGATLEIKSIIEEFAM